jgi:hypothetical protein
MSSNVRGEEPFHITCQDLVGLTIDSVVGYAEDGIDLVSTQVPDH